MILSLSVSADTLTHPAQGLKCVAVDTDFKFEMIVHRFNGDLYPNTFILSEASKQIPTTIKQFSNHDSKIILVVSTGPQGDHDDLGYLRVPGHDSLNSSKFPIAKIIRNFNHC